MASLQLKLEQRLFRALNGVVEPAVRRGVCSHRLLPTTLVVLESTGYVSGQLRRTPLFCQQIASYMLVSTARGRRSFWVRNLQKQPEVRVFLGGEPRQATAHVLDAKHPEAWQDAPKPVRTLALLLRPLLARGWAFALLQTE